ncbi:MAG: hypothetical protein JWL72_113 [Ilumatobacteraceae bacterium]|nr:hypothetical protein [Ilumatobacteraceae bacterium]
MRRIFRVLLPIALSLLVIAPVATSVPTATAGTAANPDFIGEKVVNRNHLENGADDLVDTRTFTVSVSQTSQLHGHQAVDVQWTGAHPTGGIVADQNSGDAMNEEYPVVVMECRGVDPTPSTDPNTPSTVPAGTTALDPTTCWAATSAERFQDSQNTAFPPWRIDRYGSAAARQAVFGQPSPRPVTCFPQPSPSEHWVPFVAASGISYSGGANGCGGQAPEASNVGGLNLPSNTTYGVTGTDGAGHVSFDMWSTAENTSLGCSDTVRCSLVIIPIMGISCDATGASLPAADQPGAAGADADALCRAAGKYQPGALVDGALRSDVAVSGALWWSASNWQNRISVPLSFAPTADVCNVIDGKPEIDLYGSELMSQAMIQWSPRFCLDSTLFRLKHVQTPEPQARALLASGGAEAILTSTVSPPGTGRPTIVAPVAMSGFAISFTIDDANGSAVQTLRLTPRLIAKLLTESYPAILPMKQEYTALSTNPLDMSRDPEFIALNPGITQGVAASQSASTLLALSSDSDVTAALTSYINGDPEARAWLDGAPDPWGMVVNPNYRGIALPVTSWPLLDTFEPPMYYASNVNSCLTSEPVPFLPLVAAPVARLATIALDMQFALANSQTVCKAVVDGSNDGQKLVALGRQTIGYRFMLGITSLADAARFGLKTASLQTQVAATAPALFTSADGRTFVAPNDASLRATAQLLTKDPATGTWPIPYTAIRTDPNGAGAYPGTMVIYAQMPAAGLSYTDATNLMTFLTFTSSAGQVQGVANGLLAPGYMPLTAANQLQDLASAALAAATAVSSEAPPPPTVAAVPVVVTTQATTPATTPSTTRSTTPTTVRTTVPASVPYTVPATYSVPATVFVPDTTPVTSSSVPAPVRVPVAITTPSTVPPSSSTDPAEDVANRREATVAAEPPLPPGKTLGEGSSAAGRTLPLLLIVGLLGLLGASVVNLATSRRARART